MTTWTTITPQSTTWSGGFASNGYVEPGYCEDDYIAAESIWAEVSAAASGFSTVPTAGNASAWPTVSPATNTWA